ncbi:MAG: DUF883 family protein [Alphaproteobacteria bacterium]|nr:DUF883 family protein [Alphaproteobacteria bacterium]
MARANGSARKLQASYRALQDDLNAVVRDLEQLTSAGADVGIEKARSQIHNVQDQLQGLLGEAASGTERSAEEVRRAVADHPMTSLTAAFALGLAAASFFARR